MWLPRPIYESLPRVYWLMGLLLLVLMAYVGEMRGITIVYAVTAVICFVAGIIVSATRSQARKNPSDAEVTD